MGSASATLCSRDFSQESNTQNKALTDLTWANAHLCDGGLGSVIGNLVLWS